MIAYLDADILLHRACSFADDEFDGQPVGDWRQALHFFEHLKAKWLKELGEYDDYFLVVSTGRNFRYGLYADYKGNRKDIVPHPAMVGLKEEILSWQETLTEEGIEADDLIGIMCSETPDTIAVSADKDFKTVPCRLMVPTSHGRTKPDYFVISEAEADVNWLRQALTGDTTDGYKGCPGIGPVKAKAIVQDHADLKTNWTAVRCIFAEKGLSVDDALLQARLARILRYGEYNFDTKEVKLWEPK